MSDPGSTRRLLVGAALGGLLMAAAACSQTATAPASASAAASTAASTAASAAGSAAASSAEGPTITIANTASFGGLTEITVPAGQQLTVINVSTAPHTFTEGENGTPVEDPRVNEQIALDASVPITFPAPGDYHMTCTFHQAMNIVVHVE